MAGGRVAQALECCADDRLLTRNTAVKLRIGRGTTRVLEEVHRRRLGLVSGQRGDRVAPPRARSVHLRWIPATLRSTILRKDSVHESQSFRLIYLTHAQE